MRPKATGCPLRLGPADCPDIRFAGRVSSIRPAVLSEGALSSIGGRKSSRAHRTRNEKMRAVDHVTIGVTTEQPGP